MRVVVVGPGAMGCLIGGLLGAAGHEVALLDRHPERAGQLSREGLSVTAASGELRVPVRASVAAHELGMADLVVICTKAYDTGAAAAGAAPCVGAGTTVLTLQNGLGNAELLGSAFGSERVVGGTTAHGATLVGPGRVRHTGVGETVVGVLSAEAGPRLAPVKTILDGAGFETRATDDLVAALWGKAVINCAINPLAALTRRRNGELLAESRLDELLGQVATEAAQIATACGVALPYSDAPARVREVCRATAANTNSMLADVLAGRRTEIEQITGAVVAAADRSDVAAPLNRAMLALVRGLEGRERCEVG